MTGSSTMPTEAAGNRTPAIGTPEARLFGAHKTPISTISYRPTSRRSTIERHAARYPLHLRVNYHGSNASDHEAL